MLPHRALAVSAIAVAALACGSSRAFAQWPQGHSLAVGTDNTARGVWAGRVSPGETSADFYVAFGAYSGTGAMSWQVGHVGTSGQSLWLAYDVHLLNSQPSTWELDPDFAPTGLGGFTNAFPSGSSIIASTGDLQGTLSSTSPIGAPATSLSARSSCGRDGGGAFVAWYGSGFRLQRLDGSGAVAPGWPSLGWATHIAAYSVAPAMFATAPDGNGGVLVGFPDASNHAAVQRFTGDTTVAPGWPAAGLSLIPDGVTTVLDPSAPIRLVRSDATHFIAIWREYPYLGSPRIACQRFSLSGALDPGWPANGVEIRAAGPAGGVSFMTAVEDGAGGVTVGWSDTSAYLARHVRSDGTTPGVYAAGPLALFHAHTPGTTFAQGALGRGRDDGACVFWFDGATGIRGRWFDADGNVLGCSTPGDTCSALVLAGNVFGTRVPAAMSDGNGGAYLLYAVPTGSPAMTHYVTHTDFLGIPTTAVPPVAPGSTLSLAVSPNPAPGALTVRFALADGRPAVIEVHDLAGRRVVSREVSGVGEHVERLVAPGALPAGVYLVSVTHGSERRVARAALVR